MIDDLTNYLVIIGYADFPLGEVIVIG